MTHRTHRYWAAAVLGLPIALALALALGPAAGAAPGSERDRSPATHARGAAAPENDFGRLKGLNNFFDWGNWSTAGGCQKGDRGWTGADLTAVVTGPAKDEVEEFKKVWHADLVVRRGGREIERFPVDGEYWKHRKYGGVQFRLSCDVFAALADKGYGAKPARFGFRLVDATVEVDGETVRVGASDRGFHRANRWHRVRPTKATTQGDGAVITAKVQRWGRTGDGFRWVTVGAGVPVRYYVTCEKWPTVETDSDGRIEFPVDETRSAIEVSMRRTEQAQPFWGAWHLRRGGFKEEHLGNCYE